MWSHKFVKCKNITRCILVGLVVIYHKENLGYGFGTAKTYDATPNNVNHQNTLPSNTSSKCFYYVNMTVY